MKKAMLLAPLACAAAVAHAQPSAEVVCSYASSQSKLVAGVYGIAGGAAVTTAAIAKATGLAVVAHSSGAYKIFLPLDLHPSIDVFQ